MPGSSIDAPGLPVGGACRGQELGHGARPHHVGAVGRAPAPGPPPRPPRTPRGRRGRRTGTRRSPPAARWSGGCGRCPVWQIPQSASNRKSGVVGMHPAYPRGYRGRMAVPAPGRSLAEAHPDVAAEADGWDPDLVSAGSRAQRTWRCRECDTIWTAEVRARSRGHRPCPTCSQRTHPPLSQTHPEIAAQMLPPFNPDDYTHGSKTRVRWRGPRDTSGRPRSTTAPRAPAARCAPAAPAAARVGDPTPVARSPIRIPRSLPRPTAGTPPPTGPARARGCRGSAPTCGHRWTSTVFRRTQRPGCPACARARR